MASGGRPNRAEVGALEPRIAQQLGQDLFALLAHFAPADPPLPTTEAEVDAFVKARTKLYMDTWVIPKIEQLLEHEEKSTPAGRKRAELRCGTCEECREGLQCRDFPEPDADGDLA